MRLSRNLRSICDGYPGYACIAVQKLPFIHGDPFDRLIIAQASNRECKLVTKDENIHKYQTVETVW